MPIYVISTIKQKNGAIFPLLDDADLLGGFRTKDTTAARDAIPASYRKQGMFVWTNDTEKLWRLNADLTSWTEIVIGGGSSNSLIDTALAGGTFAAGDPVSLNSSGEFVKASAGVGGSHEVYGIALSPGTVAVPTSVDVVTSGVVAGASWTLTPGDTYFLDLAGGITNTPPDIGTAAGQALIRVGTARTTGTLLVRPQVIAFS